MSKTKQVVPGSISAVGMVANNPSDTSNPKSYHQMLHLSKQLTKNQ